MYRNFGYLDTSGKLTERMTFEANPVRVYVDESGYSVCHIINRGRSSRKKPKTLLDLLYDDAKKEYVKKNPKSYVNSETRESKFDSIKNILKQSVANRKREVEELNQLVDSQVEEYCDEKCIEETHGAYAKRKRFMRKVFFNKEKYNYWFTITCDSSLFDSEEDCFKHFERWIANNAYRYGIKILGRYEVGELNGRIHFHAFGSFPDDFFDNDFAEVERYSDKDKCWKTFKESKELRAKFGINMFEPIGNMDKTDFLKTLKYTCKYTIKQECKTYYSRGLPDSVEQFADFDDMYFTFEDGIFKYYARDGFEVARSNEFIKFKHKGVVQRELRKKMGIPEPALVFN